MCIIVQRLRPQRGQLQHCGRLIVVAGHVGAGGTGLSPGVRGNSPVISKRRDDMLQQAFRHILTLRKFYPAIILFALFVSTEPNQAATPVQSLVLESLDIARVESGFPVGFCLLTQNNRQFVAYYDAKHALTVATRTLDSDRWEYQTLPSKVGWDSHNYIAMALDEGGHIHLSGNMHATPLDYFRTSKPWDIKSFERIPRMTGNNEGSTTYPKFLRGADGRLIFHYRTGASGNGNELYNVYDAGTKTWQRLLDKTLTDGRGKRNAYAKGPFQGPDGLFHLAWVWRDSADCSTNYDPSYARSRDLIRWETVDGKPVPLPITIDSKETLIARVPVNSGLINGCLAIGFDHDKQAVATYHRFDSDGKTQVYAARFDHGQWASRQITHWDYRWEFEGNGSIPFQITLGSIRIHGPGKLALPYEHIRYGKGLLVIDEKTFEPMGTEPEIPDYPAELGKPESCFPGMTVNWSADEGKSGDSGFRYVLRWETLPANRDKRPVGSLPEPSTLRVYKLRNKPNENIDS